MVRDSSCNIDDNNNVPNAEKTNQEVADIQFITVSSMDTGLRQPLLQSSHSIRCLMGLIAMMIDE